MTRRRIRKASVPCPRCGAEQTVVPRPALYRAAEGERDAAVLLTVSCTNRHCGADVPVHASDVRRAA